MNKSVSTEPKGNAINTLLYGVVYTLLNPEKPGVEECTITYMNDAWLLNWTGKNMYTIEQGETGFFKTLKAAKMYTTKRGLCTGNKSKWSVSYNAV